MVAAHQARRDDRHVHPARGVGGEDEALGDVVAVIINERALNDGDELGFADLTTVLVGELSDELGHFPSDGRDERAILLGEDFRDLARKKQVGQGIADDVGEAGGVGAGGGGTGGSDWEGLAPVKAGFGVSRRADSVFEGDVFAEEREFGIHETIELTGVERKDGGRSLRAWASGGRDLDGGKLGSKNRNCAKVGAQGGCTYFWREIGLELVVADGF